MVLKMIRQGKLVLVVIAPSYDNLVNNILSCEVVATTSGAGGSNSAKNPFFFSGWVFVAQLV
jgi:hypothetical protein